MFKNIIANYIGRIWSIISVFVFVPLYIKLLGIESYAIISFYTVILTLMFFADAGLSATLNREIARTNNKEYLSNLLHTIERIYFLICITIFLVIFFLSGLIAHYWFKTTIPTYDLKNFITLIGLSVSFQLFTSLENSGLMGMEKQVLANTIQITGNFIRTALVLIPLYFIRNLYIYFCWQAATNITVFFVTRYKLWSYIKTEKKRKFDKTILKTVGAFALGMMAMSIISSLNTQIDKLLISKLLSLKQFGYYSISGILSQCPEIIITPIALAILPKITKLSELNDTITLKRVFHHYTFLMSIISCSVTTVLFLYTKDYIILWTHDKEIAEASGHIAKILLVGSVFLSFQYMPFYLSISRGYTKSNIRFGITSILLIIPILILFIKNWGLNGAPWPWLVLNVIAYLYLGYYLIRKFLPGEFIEYLLMDTIMPLIICIISGGLCSYFTENLPKGYMILIYSAFVAACSTVLSIIAYNKFKPESKISLSVILHGK